MICQLLTSGQVNQTENGFAVIALPQWKKNMSHRCAVVVMNAGAKASQQSLMYVPLNAGKKYLQNNNE